MRKIIPATAVTLAVVGVGYWIASDNGRPMANKKEIPSPAQVERSPLSTHSALEHPISVLQAQKNDDGKRARVISKKASQHTELRVRATDVSPPTADEAW